MTIWTLQQIEAVKRLRSTTEITEAEIAASLVDMVDQVKQLTVERLISKARAYGVELHEGDIECAIQENPAEDRRIITGWWAPATRGGVIRGNASDGKRYVVPDLRSRSLQILMLGRAPSDIECPVTLSTRTVSLVGWNETERYWVYE